MPSSKTPSICNFKYYLFFTFLLLAFSWVVIPRYYQVPVLKKSGPVFGDSIKMTYQHHLIEIQPTIVLLGDSTLLDSIDEAYLTALLDEQVYRIGNPGSASAVWYLILKNNIATSPYKPKHLVIFSRSAMLTTPEYRTTGTYQEFITEAALPDDNLLVERAYLSQMNWLERNLDHVVPLYSYRSRVRKSLENLSKYHLPKLIVDATIKDIDTSLDTVFGNPDIVQLGEAITTAENYLLQDEKMDFNAQLAQSFLPEIMRICKENNIQLTLVYTRTIYTTEDEARDAKINAYRDALFEYARENNVHMLDYALDERVQESFFNDPVHMNEYGRQAFTEIFAADFAQFLP